MRDKSVGIVGSRPAWRGFGGSSPLSDQERERAQVRRALRAMDGLSWAKHRVTDADGCWRLLRALHRVPRAEIGKLMQRPCLGLPGSPCGTPTTGTRCPSCERERQRARNAQPQRAIYRGDWPAESRAIRMAQPWCSVCGTSQALTVDHPTRSVRCRRCHGELEARRRREGRTG